MLKFITFPLKLELVLHLHKEVHICHKLIALMVPVRVRVPKTLVFTLDKGVHIEEVVIVAAVVTIGKILINTETTGTKISSNYI